MTTVARVITVSTTVALLSVPAFAQEVTYQVRRGDDVSELRTFTITETPRTNVTTSPWWAYERANVTASQPWWAYERAILQQNTDAAVAAQLEARGFRRDDAHPDMYVTTHRTVQTEDWKYGWSGWGDDDWSHYGYGSDYLDSTVVSTLFIYVTSANTGELLWRGIGMRHMHFTASPKDRVERIHREVRTVFKDYPFGMVATTGRGMPTATDR
jgi:Domain of unknown function (DUF4136)